MPDDDFDPSSFLPYLLNQAAEASSQEFQTVYKNRYGMLRTEWRVLFHVGGYGRMTATEIGAKASIHKTKISRAVHRLEARRFLKRQRNVTDKRFEFLELTTTGQKAYRDLRTEAARHDKALVERFSPQEVDLLRDMLRRLS